VTVGIRGALFPVALDELVPEDHLCRVIDAFGGSLELVQLVFSKAQPAATGCPAYDPADLRKLYLYGYLQQVRSSRRWERECQRNVELMRLLNRFAPDHKTIAEFRRHEGAALRAVAAAFVRFCRGQGLIRGEWLAIDGSKFDAVVSLKAVVRRFVARHLHEATLQRMHARATPELMRLRRCVVEHPFAGLKYRIFEKPRFLLRGRWGAGTEMSLATLVWNLKRAMKVLDSAALAERLARA
jgi:transposase